MKNIIRKVLAFSLCLFVFTLAIAAQESDPVPVDDGSSIEKSFTIPTNTTTGFSESETGSSSSVWFLIRMVLVLALICLIIWFVGKLLKKRMEPGAEPDLYLKKTAQLTLAPGRTVQIVTLRDRAYVLGVSDSGISLIDKIDGKGDSEEKQGKIIDKELIDDMNLKAADNLNAKPKDFASMISAFSSSSKRTEDFLKNRRMNFTKKGEGK